MLPLSRKLKLNADAHRSRLEYKWFPASEDGLRRGAVGIVRGAMMGARVNHQRRVEGQRPAPALPRLEDHPLGRSIASGLERLDGDAARPTVEMRQNLTHPLGSLDQGEPSSGAKAAQSSVEKDRKGGAGAVRDVATGILGRAGGARLKERWVCDHVVGRELPEVGRRRPEIAGQHSQMEVVGCRVLAREACVSLLQLDAHGARSRHAGQKRKGRDAHPTSEIENTLSRLDGRCGGKKHWVSGGAVAGFRLADPKPPAEKQIL